MSIVSSNPVRDAQSAYAAANPNSAAQYQVATHSMPGGNTRSVLYYPPFPLAMKRGEGPFLWDMDDHRYVDFLGEYTAGIFGHSHPRILEAIRQALTTGLNLSSHTQGEADLSRAICARFPCFDMVRLTNSGTEANIMALSSARAFTKRSKIVVFNGAYHGGPLSFVGKPSAANIPYELIIAPYNDLAGTCAAIEQEKDDVAAILVEPMLGSGGCIPGDPAFLRGLRDWCDAYGALLIFDEVMTSRVHPNGRQAELNIRPDLTVMGKYIGGGMSFGVFGGRADIMAQFDPRNPERLAHAGTFNNNVLTMKAGLVGLTEIYTESEAVRLNAMGDALRNRLNEICNNTDSPVQFTGLGSIMNLHTQQESVTRPEQVAHEDKALKELIFLGLLNRGFYVAPRGLISLNVCQQQEHMDGFAEAFSDTLLEISNEAN